MFCIWSGQKVKTKLVLGGLIQKPSETRSLATISCFLVILEVLDHLNFSVLFCLDVFGFVFEFFVPYHIITNMLFRVNFTITVKFLYSSS